MPKAPPPVRLSETQRRVIREKYQRDAPSVEAWLEGVARNVALAEVLLRPEAESWGVFAGVRRRVLPVPPAGAAPASRMDLYHREEDDAGARRANFRRLLENAEAACARHPAARGVREAWADAFYGLMASWDFLPNSPTLMNAGRPLQQLSACYVLPVPDSLEGIMKAVSAQAAIQQSGGGTGFSFSSLRPEGDPVARSAGTASGPLSFMRLFDATTDVIKQGGTRRGANMAILRYDHPQILDFVRMKLAPGAMENFNLSVATDAAFFRALDADAEYDLVNPRTGRPAGRVRARAVLDAVAEAAWRTGDPGCVFLDRVNGPGSNPTPALGRIEATNPCGEEPLLPWEPCNLGSLNLSNFVSGPLLSGRFDLPRLEEAAALAVRFLDDVIEVNDYPLPEIERMAKGNRRVGLGVMGWAEALVKCGVPYDSDRALSLAEEVMGAVDSAALRASEGLARERGVYPNWRGSVDDPTSPHFRGRARLPRNCARTTIAPTGTIALAAGLQGSGIEPFFAMVYERRGAKALDAARAGRPAEAGDVLREENPLFREVAAAHAWFGLDEETLWTRAARRGRSARGLPEVPAPLQAVFASAHDVSVEAHVRMQAAFQRHVDNGVSKTINLPADAAVDDVRRAYLLAYDLGCKGITVYRDGSKGRQVLSAPEAEERCPRCGSAAVSRESGCSGALCRDCGYSACS